MSDPVTRILLLTRVTSTGLNMPLFIYHRHHNCSLALVSAGGGYGDGLLKADFPGIALYVLRRLYIL
jgi:hypothetical protein